MSIIFLASTGGLGPGMINMIFIGLMMLVFWWFILRPQAAKAKEQEEFMNNLKRNDRVITNSGVHGKVMQVNDTTVYLEIARNTQITIEKTAIARDYSTNEDGDNK